MKAWEQPNSFLCALPGQLPQPDRRPAPPGYWKGPRTREIRHAQPPETRSDRVKSRARARQSWPRAWIVCKIESVLACTHAGMQKPRLVRWWFSPNQVRTVRPAANRADNPFGGAANFSGVGRPLDQVTANHLETEAQGGRKTRKGTAPANGYVIPTPSKASTAEVRAGKRAGNTNTPSKDQQPRLLAPRRGAVCVNGYTGTLKITRSPDSKLKVNCRPPDLHHKVLGQRLAPPPCQGRRRGHSPFFDC